MASNPPDPGIPAEALLKPPGVLAIRLPTQLVPSLNLPQVLEIMEPTAGFEPANLLIYESARPLGGDWAPVWAPPPGSFLALPEGRRELLSNPPRRSAIT